MMKWGLGSVRSKSDSDGSFLSFLNFSGVAPKAIFILVVGILLLVIGTMDFGSFEDPGEEEKIREMCAMTEGVGECRAVVTYSSDGESVFAVAILCEGADSLDVRKRVTETICSLYGIGAHRVSVIRLSQ